MKKIFFLALSVAFAFSLQAQNARYVSVMKQNIAILDSAKTPGDLQNAANNFERIANAEKEEWLPNYYAAYAYIMKAYYTTDMKEVDPACDKADALLAMAESLSPNKVEIAALKSMLLTARMRVDGSRGMTMGPKATKILQDALQIKADDNPRLLLQLAQMKYYTPSAFGGSKDAGIDLLKKTVAAYESFKPATDIDPNWGKAYATGLLEQWTSK